MELQQHPALRLQSNSGRLCCILDEPFQPNLPDVSPCLAIPMIHFTAKNAEPEWKIRQKQNFQGRLMPVMHSPTAFLQCCPFPLCPPRFLLCSVPVLITKFITKFITTFSLSLLPGPEPAQFPSAANGTSPLLKTRALSNFQECLQAPPNLEQVLEPLSSAVQQKVHIFFITDGDKSWCSG